MIVTFTPDDGEKREWNFQPSRLLTTEAEAIEKVTGQTYADWGQTLLGGGMAARRALVWVLRKRDGEPDLRFRDVDFPVGALEINLDGGEKERVRQAIERDPHMSDEDREAAYAELGAPEGGDPKDEATSNGVDGG
jgi:hypothetical protein